MTNEEQNPSENLLAEKYLKVKKMCIVFALLSALYSLFVSTSNLN